MEQFKTKNQNNKNQNNNSAIITQLSKGRIPPQAVDLEKTVLGGLLIDKKGLDDVIDILSPEVFYRKEHQLIFDAIFKLFGSGQPIDIFTVGNQLRKEGNLNDAGGDIYLIELSQIVSSAAHIEFHSRIIQEKYILRKLIEVSSNIIDGAFDETTDVFNLLDKSENSLFEITNGTLKRSFETSENLVREAIKKIQSLYDKKGMSGVSSGFKDVDAVTSGWQESDLIIIAARPGMGKCLGKGTKVLMFDGTLKKVEDVLEGDLLMGDDSNPRKVLSIARGKEKMYWIHQNKAISYRVNESHILSLKRSRNENNHTKGEILNISVKEYLEKSNKFKSNYKGYKVDVEFEEKKLILEPYYLGLWLGDGSAESQIITNIDSEIIKYLEDYSIKLSSDLKYHKQENKTPNYTIVKKDKSNIDENQIIIQTELRQLNLINNKHIPNDYLINSKSNRLELLAGFIDSDGYYSNDYNCFEIVQKNENLLIQFKFLCDSLGFRTSLKKKNTSIKKINFKGEAYRLRIFGNLDTIPTKIKRKKARAWKSKIDWKVTGIKVEYDKIDDYYGFEIDGNKLFLLEDMTVTHNTAFVLSMAKNIAIESKTAVGIFSLEMPSVQLIMRLISSETGIASEKLRKGELSDDEWSQLYLRVKTLEEAPIYIDDQAGISIFDFRAKARRLVSQFGVKIIIVDYLQLMTAGGSGGNREQEISTISRGLKGIAKELSIPVIALSQLSRQVEARPGHKRPQLSDLRESGAIEQDADIVSFIYRPEYYKIEYWDDESNEPTEGQAEFIIAKHRNGSLENIKLRFIGGQAKFTDLTTDYNYVSNQFESKINNPNDNQQNFESKINIPTINPADSFGIQDDDDGMPF